MSAKIVACAFVLAIAVANAEEYFVGKPHSGWWHTTVKYDAPDTRPVWFGGTLKCENAFPPTRAWMAQEFGVSVVLINMRTQGVRLWEGGVCSSSAWCWGSETCGDIRRERSGPEVGEGDCT